MQDGTERILVIHPDDATCRSIEQGLRRVAGGPVAVSHAASPTEGLASAARLDPDLVFLDLSGDHGLALEVARELRRPDRLQVGLYNPLVLRHGEEDFFRQANRAGIGDFVPLPAADAELSAVLAVAAVTARPGGARPRGKVVTLFSPKGGVGTTTLAVNVALVLAASDLVEGEVALCDAALRLSSAASFLGLAPRHDLAEMASDLDQLHALSTYLAVHPESSLRLLASPRDPIAADRVTPDDMSRILIALRRRFELVVVDTSPVVDLLNLAVLDVSDAILVVTEAIAPTLLATSRALDLLAGQGFGGERLRLVLNRHMTSEGNLSEDVVGEQLGRPPDHWIPYDPEVLSAANRGVPLVVSRQQAAFSSAIGRLAEDAARTAAQPP